MCAVLPLPGAAMSDKRRIVPVGREGIGTQFLELLPSFRGQIFDMGMDIHRGRRAAQNNDKS
jgi:hypothetical protein